MATATKIFVGRRKAAVARVRMERGSGVITVNGREFSEYFTTEKLRAHVLQPILAVDTPAEEGEAPVEPKALGKFDFHVNVFGGGTTGQAGATRLGIARAMIDYEPEWRPPLKKAGMLTRDSRRVERKKFGLKKARRAPQFSKR